MTKAHFNGLTPAQAERLAILAEEAGEVIQMVGKVLRHGYHSHHPDTPSISNRALLAEEVGDLRAVIDDMSAVHNDFDAALVEHRRRSKLRRLDAGSLYLHHQHDDEESRNG